MRAAPYRRTEARTPGSRLSLRSAGTRERSILLRSLDVVRHEALDLRADRERLPDLPVGVGTGFEIGNETDRLRGLLGERRIAIEPPRGGAQRRHRLRRR